MKKSSHLNLSNKKKLNKGGRGGKKGRGRPLRAQGLPQGGCVDCLGSNFMITATGACWDMTLNQIIGTACSVSGQGNRGEVTTTDPMTDVYGDCSPWECPGDWNCFLPSYDAYVCSVSTDEISCSIAASLGQNCHWSTTQWDSWSGTMSDAGNGGVCMCGNTSFSSGMDMEWYEETCCRGFLHEDFVEASSWCGCTDCDGQECCSNGGQSYADYWIGDGYCDDGTDNGYPMDNGNFANFNCATFQFDGGDCAG